MTDVEHRYLFLKVRARVMVVFCSKSAGVLSRIEHLNPPTPRVSRRRSLAAP
jgi:hypothetical protein